MKMPRGLPNGSFIVQRSIRCLRDPAWRAVLGYELPSKLSREPELLLESWISSFLRRGGTLQHLPNI